MNEPTRYNAAQLYNRAAYSLSSCLCNRVGYFSFTVRVQSSNKLLQCINLQSCSLSPGNTATLRFIGLWRERRVVVGLAVVKQEINEFWDFGNEKSIYLSINLYFE